MAPLQKWYFMTLTYFFKLDKIVTVNISDAVRASTKIGNATYIDFDICHWITLLQKLYTMNLTYFSKPKIWNINIPEMVRDSA